MIGAIIGDIVGSRFEFNNCRGTDFDLFHRDCSFTDDTVCTIAVADWLLNPSQNLAKIMRDWCNKYSNPAGGYGNNFKQWVKGYIKGPYNSFGNGSAMRVSPVGWAFNDYPTVLGKARQSAVITHNHPEGIKGAQCIAASIFMLRKGMTKEDLVKLIEIQFNYNITITCRKIRRNNQFDETCQVTVPQAIVSFLESTDFESAVRLAVSIGGDSDTIAAIAGSLAEAYYGIPELLSSTALAYLPDDLLMIIHKFREKYYIPNLRYHVN